MKFISKRWSNKDHVFFQGFDKIAELLIKKAADVNIVGYQRSVLPDLSYDRKRSVCLFNCIFFSFFSETALTWAIEKGNRRMSRNHHLKYFGN